MVIPAPNWLPSVTPAAPPKLKVLLGGFWMILASLMLYPKVPKFEFMLISVVPDPVPKPFTVGIDPETL